MDIIHDDELRLIQDCLKGDSRSQKLLHDRLCEKMYQVCLRYSRNPTDAEDVLQEGFVKLFNNLHRFRSEGSFEGWTRRIFINTAIEKRKKRWIGGECTGLENHLHDPASSGLDILFEKDLLRKANSLSSGYKTVFNMYAVEGYSHKEIAETLGISEGTSKSQFSRAKSILRNLVEENFHPS